MTAIGASDAHGSISGAESYELTLDASGLRIVAEGAAGLFYGTRTVLQLVGGAQHRQLPALRIIDAPVSTYRGLMIDNVRKSHNFTFHMDFLERLAAYKLNVYHIHASDDQGYSMPSKSYPHLPMASALSAEEAAALQAKAAELHVNIIAELDMPGHSSALINAIPALAGSTTTGAPCRSINLTSPIAIGILQTLLGEVRVDRAMRGSHSGSVAVGVRHNEQTLLACYCVCALFVRVYGNTN